MSRKSGAGIISYFDNRDGKVLGLDNNILYLTLLDYQDEYDFPKGSYSEKLDKNSYDCAIRETFEEINLQKGDFIKIQPESYTHNSKDHSLVMFLGEIKKDSLANTRIKKNEETNVYEHKNFFWFTFETIMSLRNIEGNLLLKKYLVPSLKWANQKFTKK